MSGPLKRYRCSDCGSKNFERDICIRADCHQDIYAKDMCQAHYNRWWRRQPPDDGFWEKVDQATQKRLAARRS